MLRSDLLKVIGFLINHVHDLEYFQVIGRRIAEGDALTDLDYLSSVKREIRGHVHLFLNPVPAFHIIAHKQGCACCVKEDTFHYCHRSLYFTVPVPVIV